MSVSPLLVVAVGGNALSPPRPDASLADERRAAEATGRELAALARRGYRLLVVHGNGPQVGRLLGADADLSSLDIRVAQTQGELGYLLAAAIGSAAGGDAVALLTRVAVDADASLALDPEKPIGPLLQQRPSGTAVKLAQGWRRTVPSPLPVAVIEEQHIRVLLDATHVVAAGGGGVPVASDGSPVAGVIDKDRVAALLAIRLQADALVIGTDVDGVYMDHGTPRARLLERLGVAQARRLLADGKLAAGSMGPKVDSVAAFAASTGRTAVIAALGQLEAALDGCAGTRIEA